MNKETQFLERLQNATMSSGEKARLRTELLRYADNNPYVEAPTAPTFISVLMSSRRFPLYATLTAIIVFSGGAGTLAAESSVPGDAFYGIKIHVNEPLMSVLSPSTEGQARVSAQLATRRVDEVVTLATTGRLTEDNQQYLEDAFAKEVQNTKTNTDALSQQGDKATADAVTADFTAHLAGEAQALASIQAPTPEKTKSFLRKVIAISSGGEDGIATGLMQDRAESSATDSLDTNQEDGMSGAPAVTATTLLGSSTPTVASTTAKKSRVARVRKEGHTQALFITASTTLTNLLETSSQLAPKTDRAIQVEVKDGEKKNEGELKIDN